jgi:hypothetical protein
VNVRGTLSAANGDALAGIRLRPEAGPPSCDSAYTATYGTAVTDASGRFQLALYGALEGPACLRFFGRDTAAGSPEFALSPTITHNLSYQRQDTVVVDLRYQP